MNNIITPALLSIVLVSCSSTFSVPANTETPIPTSTQTVSPEPTSPPTPTPIIWRWSNSLATFNDMEVISSSEIWAIGQHGTIIHDRPQVMHLTNPYDFPGEYDFFGGGYLSAIDFTSENEGWITGWYGQIFRWDGESWTKNMPPDLENGLTWMDIDFAENDIGWVAGCYRNGSDDIAVLMQWNGSSWQNIPLTGEISNDYCLTDIDVVSETNVWVIGDKYQKASLLHWDGSRWKEFSLPHEFKSNLGGDSVSAISSSDVWALGADTISHWNGSAWETTELPILFWYSENNSASPVVLALSQNNAWVGGRELFRWNGNEWINAHYQAGNNYIVDIEADSEGNVWALTLLGNILQLYETK